MSIKTTDKTVSLIGFPMDLGAGRRGVDMGPSALRIAGIQSKLEALGYEVVDDGDIQVKTREVQEIGDARMRYLPEISRACETLGQRVKNALDEKRFPIILGGDHSMSIGSIAGVAAHCREQGKRLGVLWIDAHADMNTPETSPSGNIHGMPLAVSMGLGTPELTSLLGDFKKVEPHNVAIIGARSVDQGERELIRDLNVQVYTMLDVDKEGIFTVIDKVLTYFSANVDFVHVSFDLDSVDPTIVQGVGTPVPGGLSYREAHLIMEMVAEHGKMGSLEVAEVNPILDDRNHSAVFATDIICSCMGKRIL
jgi:arginase